MKKKFLILCRFAGKLISNNIINSSFLPTKSNYLLKLIKEKYEDLKHLSCSCRKLKTISLVKLLDLNQKLLLVTTFCSLYFLKSRKIYICAKEFQVVLSKQINL